ncbi:hypothetical protein VTO42DRAFT_4618 [Malbranchea cinnamomea]
MSSHMPSWRSLVRFSNFLFFLSFSFLWNPAAKWRAIRPKSGTDDTGLSRIGCKPLWAPLHSGLCLKCWLIRPVCSVRFPLHHTTPPEAR